MQEIDELNSKTKTAIYWVYGSNTLINLFTWSVTIIVARILLPDDYGVYGITTAVTGIFMLLNEIGLGSAIIQKKEISDAEINGAFTLIVVVNIGLYVIVWFSSPIISNFYGEPKLTMLVRITGICLLLGGVYKIPYSLLKKELKYRCISVVEIISKISSSITTIVLAFCGYGVWSLVFAFILYDTIRLILFFYYAKWYPKTVGPIKKAKKLFVFGTNVMTTSLLYYIFTNSDFIIAGKVLGNIQLGYYSFAFQLASIPLERMVNYIGQIIFPYFSKLQDNEDILKKYYLKSIRVTAYLSLPIFVGISLISKDAIILFLTEKWSPMTIPLQYLCLTGLFRTLEIFNNNLALAKGKATLVLTNSVILVSIMPLAFYIGSKRGIIGLSSVWLLVYPLIFMITTLRIIKTVGIRSDEYIINVLKPLIATVFMACIVKLSSVLLFHLNITNIIIGLSAQIALGITSFILFVFIVYRADFKEIVNTMRK